MEIKKETLEKILNSDVNFKRLHSEHAKLKLKIENLNKIKFPTAHEEIEKKNGLEDLSKKMHYRQMI